MRRSSIVFVSLSAIVAAILTACISHWQGVPVLPIESVGSQSSKTERVIHTFSVAEGFSPQAALLDVNGAFYGTTFLGGSYGSEGPGTVFKIAPRGKTTVLHDFNGSYGGNSIASLVNVKGTLYGTTLYGANGYGGTVFSMTQGGQLTTLHQFAGPPTDGLAPRGALIDLNGTLYGTTCAGGAYGFGTIFSITTTGDEAVIHSFSGPDGACPSAALIKMHGTLYGTTSMGGSANNGTVFSATTTGSEEVLHSFSDSPDGSRPVAALTVVSGTIYGTTAGGGLKKCRCGTVFSIDALGNEKILHSFGDEPDGAEPEANLLDVNGTLYGTTAAGGRKCAYFGTCGTVFSITTSGDERVLYSFKGDIDDHHTDGSAPLAGLVDFKGKLYGTTAGGGHPSNACLSDSSGCGTVFEIRL